MASAYATFANGGTRHEPIAISEIVSRTGETVFKADTTGEQAISPSVASAVTGVLEGVMTNGLGAPGNPPQQPARGRQDGHGGHGGLRHRAVVLRLHPAVRRRHLGGRLQRHRRPGELHGRPAHPAGVPLLYEGGARRRRAREEFPTADAPKYKNNSEWKFSKTKSEAERATEEDRKGRRGDPEGAGAADAHHARVRQRQHGRRVERGAPRAAPATATPVATRVATVIPATRAVIPATRAAIPATRAAIPATRAAAEPAAMGEPVEVRAAAPRHPPRPKRATSAHAVQRCTLPMGDYCSRARRAAPPRPGGPPARRSRAAHVIRSVSPTRPARHPKQTASLGCTTHAPYPRQTEAPVVHHDDWGFFMMSPFSPSCPTPSPLSPPPSASPEPYSRPPRRIHPLESTGPERSNPGLESAGPIPEPLGSSCRSDMTKPPFETTRLFQKVVLSQKWHW